MSERKLGLGSKLPYVHNTVDHEKVETYYKSVVAGQKNVPAFDRSEVITTERNTASGLPRFLLVTLTATIPL